MSVKEWIDFLPTIGLLLFGGGGLVAMYRARSQNRVDEQTTVQGAQSLLNSSQTEFRTHILVRLGELEDDKEKLLNDNATMQAQIAIMSNQIDRVQHIMLERDLAIRDRDRAFTRIAQLETQVADLTKQVDELTKHKDGPHE